MSQALIIEVGAGPMHLLGERAAYLPEPGLLLIADAHLGKAQSFRRLGVPVPTGTTAENLLRLTSLIQQTTPRELVFLGDLLHARHGRSSVVEAAIAAWRAQHSELPMRLIRGNHDSRAGDPPLDWDVAVVDEPWRCGEWALCHHPQTVAGAYAVAGHVHPGAWLGRGIDRMRLPCFFLGQQHAILPAFGEFTGLHPVRPAPEDRIAVVAQGQVRLLPS